MTEYIEIKHTKISEGKDLAKEALSRPLILPKWKPVLAQGRWRAVKEGEREPDNETKDLVLEALKDIPKRTVIADQRDIFYTLRMGKYTNAKFRGNDFAGEKVYDLFVDEIMEKVQLASGVTLQGMGVRTGPRGFVTGIGSLYVGRLGKYADLEGAVPITLSFDLADTTTTYEGHARKVIHFEKAAGFEALITGDVPTMIEANFSTSQGYLVESANKFLRSQEDRGIPIYTVHDGDPHGMQIQLMYGLASKNSAYMPSEFYPRKSKILGFFPRVGEMLNLPPEHVKATHEAIFNNLKQIATAHPEFKEDVDIIINKKLQWEFQALNGLHERAGSIYLVEGLRAKEDEIKYVPDPSIIREEIVDEVKKRAREFVDKQIESIIEDAINRDIKPAITESIKTDFEPVIEQYTKEVEKELEKIDQIDPQDLREAVKLKLVDNPKQFWDDAVRQIVRQVFSQKFEFTLDLTGMDDCLENIEHGEPSTEASFSEPEYPPSPLTKDDIVEAIEKRIITREPERKKVIPDMRQAIESVFGVPSQVW